MVDVEIAVQGAGGAAVALASGASRVELCSALDVGGLTPSLGSVDAAVATGVPVHVLVRPRAGGFRYTAAEVAVMARDVRLAVGAGAAGVVVGALRDDGELDREVIATLRDAADGHEVTVHRCVDALPDPVAALDVLATLGVTRVLTSGGAATAPDGVATLRRMVEASAGRVQVMAGGGIRPGDVTALRALGVDAVHLSARLRVDDAGPAGPGGGPAGYDVTSPELVRAAVAAARAS